MATVGGDAENPAAKQPAAERRDAEAAGEAAERRDADAAGGAAERRDAEAAGEAAERRDADAAGGAAERRDADAAAGGATGTVIVAGYDTSEESRRAVLWAARHAEGHGGRLVLVRAYTPPLPAARYAAIVPSEDLGDANAREAAQELLDDLAAQAGEAAPDATIEQVFRDGDGVATLREVADEVDAGMLALGASGSGALGRMVLGSTAAELVHIEPRPVLVVRGEVPAAEAPVVLGVDGSATSHRAAEFAFSFAARHGVAVYAVHAWSDLPLAASGSESPPIARDEDVAELTEAYLGHWRERYPTVTVYADIVSDRPARALLARAEGARLLVVGSHGRGPIRRALQGSVARAVLHAAPCPVAVLREPIEREPAEAGSQH